MMLKLKRLDLDAGGKLVVILNRDDASEIGVHPLDRVILKNGSREATAIVNVSENFVPKGTAIAYDELSQCLGIQTQKEIEIRRREELQSKKSIKRKINGSKLSEREIKEIVNDVVARKLNDLEISAFITALHVHGLSSEEIVSLINAMSESGKTLKIKKKLIMDKHSLGGCPGDKTTIILVPTIAACGLTIPKTSSRSITSPAGTADRFEILASVNLNIREMERVVNKTNGCIVWGGALDMSPADDLFIRIEYPLGLDPLYIPSIMSKKKSVNATHLVVDIPTGKGTKVKTRDEAYDIAGSFIDIGKRIGINTVCGITFGEQPIGHCIGPALEAREALSIITKPTESDVIEKAVSLAGILLESAGKGNRETAMRMLKTGKAKKKLMEIIEAQGGNPKIRPSDIAVGEKQVTIKSSAKGTVLGIRNAVISEIAKFAGAPKDKGAGVVLHAKIGARVSIGDPLFTIYAERQAKLNEAEKLAISSSPFFVVEKMEKIMPVDKVEEAKYEKYFILER